MPDLAIFIYLYLLSQSFRTSGTVPSNLVRRDPPPRVDTRTNKRSFNMYRWDRREWNSKWWSLFTPPL